MKVVLCALWSVFRFPSPFEKSSRLNLKSTSTALILFSGFGVVCAQSFVAHWDLSYPGSNPNHITFNAVVAPSGAVYSWESIPSGSAGGGTLAAGSSLRTISGIPTNATIRLEIASGNLQQFSINDGADKNRLILIENWGTSNWTSMNAAFYGCTNLQIEATNIPNLGSVSDMISMFRDCSSLNDVPNIEQWNTSSVTSMSGMFAFAALFNQPLTNWNTSNVTDMSLMFQAATSFNQELGSWTLHPNVNLAVMLDGSGLDCKSYGNTLIGWAENNPTVINRNLGASGLFHAGHASISRQELIINQNWTISDNGVAVNCDEFRTLWDLSLDVGSGANNILITGMNDNSQSAKYYWETVPAASSGFGTLNAGGFGELITGIPTGAMIRLYIESEPLKWFVPSLTADANRLVDIESWGSAQWNSLENSYQGCTNMDISATDVPDFSNVINMNNTFRDCSSLVGTSSFESFDVSSVTTMENTFRGASLFNQNLNNWNTSNVQNMASMFRGASLFNGAITGWDVSQNSDFRNMFEDAGAFNQDISTWSPSISAQISSMFKNATSFNQPIGSWLLGSTDVSSVFEGASNFNQPLDNWFSGKFNYASMFKNATSFNQNLSTWVMNNATDMTSMFEGATAFNQDLGAWTLNTNFCFMTDIFQNTGLDCENYSYTLIGWRVNNPAVFGRDLGSSNLVSAKYANGSKNHLLNTFGWQINDAGEGDCGGFNTIWDLSLDAGSGPNDISFTPDVTFSGSAEYFWETIPAMSSGFGTIGDGLNPVFISGIPNNATIRLTIQPKHLQDFRINNNSDRHRIIDVESWGAVQWQTMLHSFKGCSNLEISAVNPPDLSNCLSFFQAFMDCSSLNDPNIANWDVAQAFVLDEMFLNAQSFNQNLGSWVLHPSVSMNGMLSSSGLDCSNYSATLQGWHDNNPTVINRPLGAGGRVYNSLVGSNERNELVTNRGWSIVGDALSNAQATLVANNTTLPAYFTCDEFVNFSINNEKLIEIDPNGNALDLETMSVVITAEFAPSLPVDVTTSDNGGGYYEIHDGLDILRISKRLTTIMAPGSFTNNGGVLVRVYYSADDITNIQSDAVPSGVNAIGDAGWFKAGENNVQNLINGLTPLHPFMNPSGELTPVASGTENGVEYVEFLMESFSTIGFYAKSSPVPLPVTFTSFRSNCLGDIVELNWETASEFGALHYAIESSRDGFNWQFVAEIDAVGTTNQSSQYSVKVPNSRASVYYRLFQVDLDGAQEIFGPFHVNCSLESSVMTVFPNPSAGEINVTLSSLEDYGWVSLELVDLYGRVIIQKEANLVSGSATYKLNTSELMSGTYVVRVRNLNDQFTPIRVVKM